MAQNILDTRIRDITDKDVAIATNLQETEREKAYDKSTAGEIFKSSVNLFGGVTAAAREVDIQVQTYDEPDDRESVSDLYDNKSKWFKQWIDGNDVPMENYTEMLHGGISKKEAQLRIQQYLALDFDRKTYENAPAGVKAINTLGALAIDPTILVPGSATYKVVNTAAAGSRAIKIAKTAAEFGISSIAYESILAKNSSSYSSEQVLHGVAMASAVGGIFGSFGKVNRSLSDNLAEQYRIQNTALDRVEAEVNALGKSPFEVERLNKIVYGNANKKNAYNTLNNSGEGFPKITSEGRYSLEVSDDFRTALVKENDEALFYDKTLSKFTDDVADNTMSVADKKLLSNEINSLKFKTQGSKEALELKALNAEREALTPLRNTINKGSKKGKRKGEIGSKTKNKIKTLDKRIQSLKDKQAIHLKDLKSLETKASQASQASHSAARLTFMKNLKAKGFSDTQIVRALTEGLSAKQLGKKLGDEGDPIALLYASEGQRKIANNSYASEVKVPDDLLHDFIPQSSKGSKKVEAEVKENISKAPSKEEEALRVAKNNKEAIDLSDLEANYNPLTNKVELQEISNEVSKAKTYWFNLIKGQVTSLKKSDNKFSRYFGDRIASSGTANKNAASETKVINSGEIKDGIIQPYIEHYVQNMEALLNKVSTLTGKGGFGSRQELTRAFTEESFKLAHGIQPSKFIKGKGYEEVVQYTKMVKEHFKRLRDEAKKDGFDVGDIKDYVPHKYNMDKINLFMHEFGQNKGFRLLKDGFKQGILAKNSKLSEKEGELVANAFTESVTTLARNGSISHRTDVSQLVKEELHANLKRLDLADNEIETLLYRFSKKEDDNIISPLRSRMEMDLSVIIPTGEGNFIHLADIFQTDMHALYKSALGQVSGARSLLLNKGLKIRGKQDVKDLLGLVGKEGQRLGHSKAQIAKEQDSIKELITQVLHKPIEDLNTDINKFLQTIGGITGGSMMGSLAFSQTAEAGNILGTILKRGMAADPVLSSVLSKASKGLITKDEAVYLSYFGRTNLAQSTRNHIKGTQEYLDDVANASFLDKARGFSSDFENLTHRTNLAAPMTDTFHDVAIIDGLEALKGHALGKNLLQESKLKHLGLSSKHTETISKHIRKYLKMGMI